MLVFDHAQQDLQEAMARAFDGAMIWGGEEAVLQVRSLPFPHWVRLAVFGLRISVPAKDADSWCNMLDPLDMLDGNVQTLGLAMADPEREAVLASRAARRGVDRIVKLGRMHAFPPLWDGVDLIRPMVLRVRHVPSMG
jgi:hypothetical protein